MKRNLENRTPNKLGSFRKRNFSGCVLTFAYDSFSSGTQTGRKRVDNWWLTPSSNYSLQRHRTRSDWHRLVALKRHWWWHPAVRWLSKTIDGDRQFDGLRAAEPAVWYLPYSIAAEALAGRKRKREAWAVLFVRTDSLDFANVDTARRWNPWRSGESSRNTKWCRWCRRWRRAAWPKWWWFRCTFQDWNNWNNTRVDPIRESSVSLLLLSSLLLSLLLSIQFARVMSTWWM